MKFPSFDGETMNLKGLREQIGSLTTGVSLGEGGKIVGEGGSFFLLEPDPRLA